MNNRPLGSEITCCFVLLSLLMAMGPVFAGGGPRNVLVVINENAEESMEIANYFVRARGIPEANICRIQTSSALSVSKATYQSEIETPIEACIANSPYTDRIDYIVLTRGLPIRASFPGGNVSLAALLQVLDTPLRGKDQEFAAPYLFQNYPNPYRKRAEYFSHSKVFGGYNLYIATMLSGYWSEDAIALVDRSLASDLNPPTDGGGVFYLEDASGNAGVRNADFPNAVSRLQGMGFAAEHIVQPADVQAGSIVASHVNGGSYSGISKAEIESYTYPAGCIVDVLESYGLVPNNFTPGANPSQTPVTWWITAGVTGGHGTVSEPYNVAFPDGYMLEPYVAGYSLAETFYQGIPFLYWMNLVLGDPLAAPYAVPPLITIQSPAQSATVSGMVTLDASASTTKPGGIAQMEYFVDDTLVQTFLADTGQALWDSTAVSDGWHRFEVVAYENTPQYAQATAGVDLRVNNQGVTVDIPDPPAATQVAGVFQATVTATAAITDVAVDAQGLVVGTASGTSPFTVDVDTSLLGRGWNTFVATGTDGASSRARSAGVEFYVVKPPRINALTPPYGPTAGGTTVVIDGWNFEPGPQVFFGAAEAASVTWIDANHVEAVTPPGSRGFVEVRLDGIMGMSTSLVDGFKYITAPTITQVSPATGPETGGVIVTIDGLEIEPQVRVYFGANESLSVTWVSELQVTAETPPGTAGLVDVRLDNPMNLSATAAAAYEYLSTPGITAVTPAAGPVAGGTRVTLDGWNFDPLSRVFFGPNVSTNVTYFDATRLEAETPPGTAGFVEVLVENPLNVTGSLPDGFRYLDAPVVDTLTPVQGPAAGGTQVDIRGSLFEVDIDAFFGGVKSLIIYFDSTRIIAFTPPGSPGLVDVVLENPPGMTTTIPNGFEYLATPDIASVNPAEGPEAGGTSVTLLGSYFDGAARVFFGANECLPVNWIDAGTLMVTTPPGAPGFVNVTVRNPDSQEGTLPNGFEYLRDPCPVSAAVAGLKLAKDPAGKIEMAWNDLVDPCLALYRVFVAIDPVLYPLFPGEYTEITNLDEDGNPGGDAGFVYTPDPGALLIFQVAAEGTDGSLGPP